MGWEDTDGDGHLELNGDVGPVAAGAAAALGTKAGLEAAGAGVAAATGVGAPVAAALTIAAGVDAAGAAAAGGLAYFADRYDWKYKIEPGQVIEDTGEAIESAGEAIESVFDKSGIGRPFTIPLEAASGSFGLGGGQVLGMPRLDAAFARLQSLL